MTSAILATVVILSAIVPTAIEQRRFSPRVHHLSDAEIADVEDAEFEPRPA